MKIDEEYFDCRLYLNGVILYPGAEYLVDVRFISPHMVLPLLSIGKPISLWEFGTVAEGVVARLPLKGQ